MDKKIKEILEQAEKELGLSEYKLAEYVSAETARQQLNQWKKGTPPDPLKLKEKIERHVFAAKLFTQIYNAATQIPELPELVAIEEDKV